MRYKSLVLASIFLTAAAYAKDPKAYQSGKLIQMDSVSCSAEKTQELLCQEYVLQAEKVIYRVRPRDAKHPVLLPVGEQAQFRFEKDKMIVRVEYVDSKEREYVVVSMTPRSESTADASPVRLNHLQ
jgi:hypothetical protein